MKARLASHMRHKPEREAKNYNLIKTMKNSAALTNEIEDKIFKAQNTETRKEDTDNSEENNTNALAYLALLQIHGGEH